MLHNMFLNNNHIHDLAIMKLNQSIMLMSNKYNYNTIKSELTQ